MSNMKTTTTTNTGPFMAFQIGIIIIVAIIRFLFHKIAVASVVGGSE